tara:strand:- start:1405 stop:1839 length:435 start_codon:yes stop_codon:yes gene_type:complete
MVRSTDITGEELDAIIAEEKAFLKEDRVYLILELDDRGKDLFSMFCLDTTTNNKDGTANICQVIGRGITDLISYSGEDVYDFGKKLIEQDALKSNNVVALDSYRNQKYRNDIFAADDDDDDDDTTEITFSFKKDDDGGDNEDGK